MVSDRLHYSTSAVKVGHCEGCSSRSRVDQKPIISIISHDRTTPICSRCHLRTTNPRRGGPSILVSARPKESWGSIHRGLQGGLPKGSASHTHTHTRARTPTQRMPCLIAHGQRPIQDPHVDLESLRQAKGAGRAQYARSRLQTPNQVLASLVFLPGAPSHSCLSNLFPSSPASMLGLFVSLHQVSAESQLALIPLALRSLMLPLHNIGQ